MSARTFAALSLACLASGCSESAPDPTQTARDYAALKHSVVNVLCATSESERAQALVRLSKSDQFQGREDDVMDIGADVQRDGCPKAPPAAPGSARAG